MNELKLIGPFKQLLTLDGLTLKGPLQDNQLEVINDGGILIKGNIIRETGKFKDLLAAYYNSIESFEEIDSSYVLMPGFVDVHTHICWAGSRANDYAMRLQGMTYQEIAGHGGGIWHTVKCTREMPADTLAELTALRANQLLHRGVTTIEVKSGYGLDYDNEIKMLESIRKAAEVTDAELIPTCLAAHIKPPDFSGTTDDYLKGLLHKLLPEVKKKNLSRRVDIYIDKGAFEPEESLHFLMQAKKLGFEITAHADQFEPGGIKAALEARSLSADHLEVISEESIKLLAGSKTVAVVLPGSSLGLGIKFAPARKLLDAGASLTIASDWNPGSAPMGNLLAEASILGIYEKLKTAEIFAGVTFRAAHALNLSDRGILKTGMKADFIAFPCSDFRDILYYQGSLLPEIVWKNGKRTADGDLVNHH